MRLDLQIAPFKLQKDTGLGILCSSKHEMEVSRCIVYIFFFPLGISLSGFLSHDGVDYLCERVCISVYVGWQLSGVHICRAVGIWGQGVGVIPFPRFGRNRCKTSSFDRPWISTCPAVNIRPIQDRATLCNELQNEIAIS